MVVTARIPPRGGDIIGRQIGSYVIESLLGQGGMGSVYTARSRWLGKRVAVKVISAEHTGEEAVVDRFFREARAVAAVDDPHIIDVYDIHQFHEDGLYYILMPFVDGMSLEAFCALHAPLPLETAFVIIMQILHGLDSVHAVGVVHRDIKPHNILVTRKRRRKFFVKIVDFGIAKLVDPQLSADFNKTLTRMVMGTIGYMAPEQARGSNVDARADVYSVGAVMFRMLTGRLPYEGDTTYAILEKQRDNLFVRPRVLRPDLPQSCEDAIVGALQPKPEKRIGSMRELAQMYARGMPNGEESLKILAPQLCADAKLNPKEDTLTGELDVSLTRWGSRSLARGRSVVPVSVALVAGMAIGGIGIKLISGAPAAASGVANQPLASTGAPHAADTSPHVASMVPDAGNQLAAVAASPVLDAINPSPPPDASPVAANADRDAGIDASSPPVAVAAPTVRPPVVSARPATPRPVSPRPAVANTPDAAPGASAKTGTLVVRTSTWATVFVDGEKVGTGPAGRYTVPVGPHKIVLVNGDQRDTQQITVGTKADAVVEAKW